MPSTSSKKVAVVTGASRGIGLAIAEALAGAGFDVAITARSTAELKSAAKKIEKRRVRVLAHPCDVRKEEDVAQLFDLVKREFGRVDVLVNNAGYSGPLVPVAETSLEQWQANVDTNLTGTFLCTRAALPLMRRGSTIVNNLSIGAKGYFEGMGAYVASKHGAMGFTLTLRAELRPKGIRVIALIPGATDTEIWKQFWPDAPRARMMSPESVASAVLNAVLLPDNATVEELVIAPTAGAL
jgi:NAD(P)-dependent dehydrogenase (short-subunit alcohol dehydrogenase family)